MTKEQLRTWRERHFGLHGNRDAARQLGLSIDQFQKRLYGSVKIDRTLELLCDALEREWIARAESPDIELLMGENDDGRCR
jgi:hypothetical protein